jgi:hypothetical protein
VRDNAPSSTSPINIINPSFICLRTALYGKFYDII